MSELTGNTEVRMGSDRAFGLVFAGVFAIVALVPLISGGGPRWWALAVAAGFAALALARPAVLRPLNRLWFRFGLLLHRIVSPIVMGVLFFLTVTPIGLAMRLRHRDLLRQKLDRKAASYWVEIDPEESSKGSMRNQF